MARPGAGGKNTSNAHWALPGSQPPRAMRLREACAAVHARELMHSQIVSAFRMDIAGPGPGPSDQDPQLFARFAVDEARLRRRFRRAKVVAPVRARASWVFPGKSLKSRAASSPYIGTLTARPRPSEDEVRQPRGSRCLDGVGSAR